MSKIFPPRLHLIVTFVWLLVATYLIFLYAPQEATMGEVQRIFYIHVASAWTALMAYFLIFLGSIGICGSAGMERMISPTARRKWVLSSAPACW